MKRTRSLFLALLLILALLTGCGSSTGTGAASSPETAEQIFGYLQNGDWGVGAPNSSGPDATYGAEELTSVSLSGSDGADLGAVSVYRFSDREAAAQAAGRFDPEDPSTFTVDNGDGTTTSTQVDFVAPVTLWQYEDVIVLYCGQDDTVAALLTHSLDSEPFATNLAPVDGSDPAATQGETNYVDFTTDLLAGAGYPVQPTGQLEDGEPFFGEEASYHYEISQDPFSALTLYLYSDGDAAQAAAAAFDPEDPSLFTLEGESKVVDYVAPVTLWRMDKAIFLYCGEDAVLADALAQVLGEPFAGAVPAPVESAAERAAGGQG